MQDRKRVTIVLAVTAAATLLGHAHTAVAGTASAASDVTYVAAAGEQNTVTATVNSTVVTFTDATAPVTAGSGCISTGAHSADCAISGLTLIGVDLGDDNDYGLVGGGTAVILGGSGNDDLTGGSGADLLDGGLGNDTLDGGEADDLLDGGLGDDTLLGGNGGGDTADYSGRANAVYVSLDGVANDGEVGESDNVGSGVEDVLGGSGDDTLTGNLASNLFAGGGGADVLDGGPGDDLLFGDAGADVITGGTGDDLFDGGADGDSIQSRDDIPEDVDCGTGTDSVTADAADSTTGCETVKLGTSLSVSASFGTYRGTANLAATLKREGVPLATKTITFTVNGTVVGTATTNSSGVVSVADVSMGDAPAGLYSAGVSATFAGDDSSLASTASAALTIMKAQQAITFGALAAKTFGDPDFTLGATSSAGLGVSFAASGSCTVGGATVHITGGGSCTVTASQAGNGNYNAAADVAQTFAVAKASQTIAFGALANKIYGAANFGVSATASSGLAVSFSASGRCTVSGSTVHISGVGSCMLTASQPGNANYAAATNVLRRFTIFPKPCTVPKVTGKRLAAAKSALARGHCRAGKVNYAYSAKEKGLVSAQSRRPGRILPASSKINLVVSRGPRP